jgi:SAM-dependent methyltransferase
LEIGVQVPELNFDKIICKNKTGVDPDIKSRASFIETSDYFFEVTEDTFDLVFIDGMHTAEQVQKDFENALKVLSPNGFIVLHDCNPIKEEHTIVPRPTPRGIWNGDVYKFASTLGVNDGYCTVDIDNGCGVFRNGIEEYEPFYPPPIFWNYFNENRKELLNLISLDEFVSIGT